jgi:hypothetical protein
MEESYSLPKDRESPGFMARSVPTLTLLPKMKSPWLNPIEPKWVHGKRKVVEPDGDCPRLTSWPEECVLPSIVCEAVGVSRLTLYRHPKPDGSPRRPRGAS